jgi:hypothetical protein
VLQFNLNLVQLGVAFGSVLILEYTASRADQPFVVAREQTGVSKVQSADAT